MSASSPTPIQSYAALQAYMDKLDASYSTGISGSPHGAFWDMLSYDQFISGNVPGVTPPAKILEIGNGAGSNIVQALQGVGPLFGATGTIGPMPADGTGPWTTAQIQPLIDWIDAKCPNSGS